MTLITNYHFTGKPKRMTLSDKINNSIFDDKFRGFIKVEDVKEFIRDLKDNMRFGVEDCRCCQSWIKNIDKLAGDDLVEEKGE